MLEPDEIPKKVKSQGAFLKASRPKEKKVKIKPSIPLPPIPGLSDLYSGIGFDEEGKAQWILKDQDEKLRVRGFEALKSNIIAVLSLCNIVKTSLGPWGMDKIIVDEGKDVTITNDGATILDKMDVQHQAARLIVELSKSHDSEVGDGTTSIVVLVGALLEHSLKLIEKGVHPLRICEGFDAACAIACAEVQKNSFEIDFNNKSFLVASAMTALGSKVVSLHKRKLAEIAVEATLGVANLEKKDCNIEFIKIDGVNGGSLEDTQLIRGYVYKRDMAHEQMPKEINDVKMAIISCQFQLPYAKNKVNLDIKSRTQYMKCAEREKLWFQQQIQIIKKAGANFICGQWGVNEEQCWHLAKENIPVIKWVTGPDIELLAKCTGAKIVHRWEDLTSEKLGYCGRVRELHLGTTKDTVIVIEDAIKTDTVSIVVRGASEYIIEEGKRCMHDAVCVIRNLIRDSRVVYGGGATELAASRAVWDSQTSVKSRHQYALRCFAEALESIPVQLAENSGQKGVEVVSLLKQKQRQENKTFYGVDCSHEQNWDMAAQEVYEPMKAKIQQYQSATQMAKMILKIDDVINRFNYEYKYDKFAKQD